MARMTAQGRSRMATPLSLPSEDPYTESLNWEALPMRPNPWNLQTARFVPAVLLVLMLEACTAAAPPRHDPPAPAADAAPAPEEQLCRQIFEMCDMDRDTRITRDEYAHGAIVTFHQLDLNHDLKLSREELGGRWDADAQAADTDGDGVLCLTEIVRHQEESFKERDINKCGRLTEEDVKIWVKTRLSQGESSAGKPDK